MKTTYSMLLGCVGLSLAGAAQAQVGGIAIADPETVILTAKALDAANTSIATTYKAQLDQATARAQALQAQLNTLYAPLDLNKDKQLSDDEIQKAQAAKNPALAQIETAQRTGQADVARLRGPATLAQAYAIEQISQKYAAAMQAVVASKKLSLLLSAGSVQFSTPAVDVTDDIKAELDRTNPTVAFTPPAGWQPSQQTQQLLQQYQQLAYISAMQRQRAAGGAAAAPAAGAKAPQGR
ncbi:MULTISPECIES: OmpH family outer membrane protein [unclassified Sphingomonas]|uniref:OmpH family outer membrane protein n=1 Tax=unclassified Sphingomonas TaxID=196159 RepID=UPI001F575E92|nr:MULTISPECIES: OmpH family outer membrane protein [unclassified Sphingomonas]